MHRLTHRHRQAGWVMECVGMRGWAEGLVELFPSMCDGKKCMMRDKESGLVCGFAPGADGEVTTGRQL